MHKFGVLLFLIVIYKGFSQESDFKHINFSRADNIAKTYKSKNLNDLNKITSALTSRLDTDVEKFRAIYIWITHNIANDFGLYSKNHRKRKRFKNDSIKLEKWNSRFKKILFKKLLKRKRTICTGYAYLLKEMCAIAGIKSIMVNGSGRTSTMDEEDLAYANHTWNLVKLNNKWYLCDPTWSTGISYPEEGKFIFNYDNGYFLTEPKIFFFNHFPLSKEHSLLAPNTPNFNEFVEMPVLYAKAYTILSDHINPKKMYHEVHKNQEFTFEYLLKKSINLRKVKFIFTNSVSERTVKPLVSLNKNSLTLKHTFKKRGFYDLHFYIGDDIIATYTFKVVK